MQVEKKYKTKNCTHSFEDTELLCTISKLDQTKLGYPGWEIQE